MHEVAFGAFNVDKFVKFVSKQVLTRLDLEQFLHSKHYIWKNETILVL